MTSATVKPSMIADAPFDPREQFFEGENVYKSSFRHLSQAAQYRNAYMHNSQTKFSQPHFHVFLFTFQSQPDEPS